MNEQVLGSVLGSGFLLSASEGGTGAWEWVDGGGTGLTKGTGSGELWGALGDLVTREQGRSGAALAVTSNDLPRRLIRSVTRCH